MNNAYYSQNIFLPQVDENDNVVGPIERWEAHKKGILHRAFTIAVFFDDQILCQHRKHPVFNDVFDFSASSHPVMTGNKPQANEEAVYQTLLREWAIEQNEVLNLKSIGHAVYDDPDPKSTYREHEFCYLFTCSINRLPQPNLEMAYGFSLLSVDDLKNADFSISKALSPWVKEFFKKGLL